VLELALVSRRVAETLENVLPDDVIVACMSYRNWVNTKFKSKLRQTLANPFETACTSAFAAEGVKHVQAILYHCIETLPSILEENFDKL
jgi:hypothetical protein